MCGLSLQQECATDHFRILLQLVGIIAMALWSCISIDFRCNYLVQLQLYWIGLLLILTVSMVILGSNNLKQCCNCQVVIATRILKLLQLHVLVATVFQGCNKFCGVAIFSYLLQLPSLLDAISCYYCHEFFMLQQTNLFVAVQSGWWHLYLVGL